MDGITNIKRIRSETSSGHKFYGKESCYDENILSLRNILLKFVT